MKNYHKKSIKNSHSFCPPLIYTSQRIHKEKALLKFIEMEQKWFSNQRTPEVLDYISKLRFVKDLVGSKVITDREIISQCMYTVSNSVVDTDNSKQHGSAMVPLFNNVWNIGIFGSIWLDFKICSKEYRLSFFDKTPPTICIIEAPSFFTSEL